jgi:hypothetical protein
MCQGWRAHPCVAARSEFACDLTRGAPALPLQSSYGFCGPSLLRRTSHWIESLWRIESPWPSNVRKGTLGTLAVNPMIRNPDFDYLFVLLAGLAVAFMLWVFWNLSKQIGRR